MLELGTSYGVPAAYMPAALDANLIQQEIEERAQELARLRWVEEGYAREPPDTDATASD